MNVTGISRTGNVATLTIAANSLGVGGTLRVEGAGSGFDGDAVITGKTTNTVSFANNGVDVGLTSVAAVAHAFDVLASQSYPSPTMPSGWTAKQCLGSVLTDGSTNIRAFTQLGDEFLLGTAVALTFSLSTLASLASCLTPADVKVFGLFRGAMTVSGQAAGNVLFSSPDETDQFPNGDNSQLCSNNIGASFGDTSGCEFSVRTNTSRQVRVRASSSSPSAVASCRGWRDPRRRLF